MMSHAIADGTAILPFLHDLADLCSEVGTQQNGKQMPKRRLPPLPHFGAILEDRLLRTLGGDQSSDDVMYLDRRMDSFEHHFPERSYRGYLQEFHVFPHEAEELRRVVDSHLIGCPMELALLALVVLSLARIDEAPQVKFTLVHHGRDHPPGAADVIGFFTDFRTLVVPTSELMSLLGVLSFVTDSIRERSWRRPAILEPIDKLINIVPSPFGPVGFLEQAPWMRARGGSWHSDGKLWQSRSMQTLLRPLELQIEQVDLMEWSINMYLDETVYPLEKGQCFRNTWLHMLRDLREAPLQGVLSGHTSASSAVEHRTGGTEATQ